MDARPVEVTDRSHRFQSVRAKQNAPATPLVSALTDLQILRNLKPSRFRTYAKTRVGRSALNHPPKTGPRLRRFYRYLFTSLLHYFAPPSSKGRYLIASLLQPFSL